MTQKLYITRCEGPITLNDNAYDLAQAYIPDGDKLFANLGKFEEYLAYIERTEADQYGSSLRYILPFLKVAGVTDSAVKGFCRQRMVLTKGAVEAIGEIKENMDVYVVGTSFCQCLESVVQDLGLEETHAFSTKVSFDAYEMAEREQMIFTGLLGALSQLPLISWDKARVVAPEAQFSIDSLKTFLQERLPSLSVYRWIKDTTPIGPKERADLVRRIAGEKGVHLKDVAYVGSDASDAVALSLVREHGGLSISFNGDRDTALNAEFLVVSHDAAILKEMMRVFCKSGKDDILEGTVCGSAFVSTHKSCDLENVIMLSENMRREVKEETAGDGQ